MSKFESRSTHPSKPEHRHWDYDLWDWADLAEERCLMIQLACPPTPELRPRVALGQWEDVEVPADPHGQGRQKEVEVREDQETGELWCYPEDLPVIIESLTRVLDALRQAAQAGQARRPAPYWGSLTEKDR